MLFYEDLWETLKHKSEGIYYISARNVYNLIENSYDPDRLRGLNRYTIATWNGEIVIKPSYDVLNDDIVHENDLDAYIRNKKFTSKLDDIIND